ncbi:MAG: AMMECR1 domain-containing protein [Patescibacteria group bacterium]
MKQFTQYGKIAFSIFVIVFLFMITLIFFDKGADEEPRATKQIYDEFSLKQKQEIASHAFTVIDEYFNSGETGKVASPPVDSDFEYDHVYVSLINQGVLRCCTQGNAEQDDKNRVLEDIKQGTEACIEDKRYGGVLLKEEKDSVIAIFDYFYNKRKLKQNDLAFLARNIEMGVHAIRIEKNGKGAYFKSSVPISKNYDLQRTLERLCAKADLEADCWQDKDTDIFIFDTLTFKSNRKFEVQDLYRYSDLVDIEEITNKFIYDRVLLGGLWFVNNVDKDTKLLEYEYHPSLDEYSRTNNYVRQFASLWAMSELKKFTGGADWDELINHSLDWYLEDKVEAEADDGSKYLYLNTDGTGKMGYSAFIMLTLLNMKDYPNRDDLLRGLADGILHQQQEGGMYKTYFESSNNSGQDFYPGEAMLGLMRYHEETKDEKYLKSVEKAFPYYRDYWRNNKNTAFVPWQSQTYYLLYKQNKNQELADFVFEMNDWLIDNYQNLPRKYPDLEGGFKHEPGNSSSAYMEGVADAYALAVLADDKEHMSKYKSAIEKGTRFILQSQYHYDNVFYLPNPDRALGGFRESLTANDQRNDYTQHAVSALMKVHALNVFR